MIPIHDLNIFHAYYIKQCVYVMHNIFVSFPLHYSSISQKHTSSTFKHPSFIIYFTCPALYMHLLRCSQIAYKYHNTVLPFDGPCGHFQHHAVYAVMLPDHNMCLFIHWFVQDIYGSRCSLSTEANCAAHSFSCRISPAGLGRSSRKI